MTAAATERVGRYQLLEPIGVGPSGTVSRAKVFGVAGFERQFAIKRFHAELTSTATLAHALSVAARAYGSLEHPRIARMSEYAVAQGVTFTAVELVAGLDALRLIGEASLAGQRLAPGGALALVSQAARAVGYAHGRGLTHLGLAPTNVMITAEGDIKITDFGILSSTLPPRPIDVPRLANRIAYLAPEQLANEATSAATDVFALGVLAFELVTGHRTFRGDTPQQIAQSVMAGPPIEPPLPRPIARVLQRCLARSPFERFPDARALADALDAALRVAPVPGTRKDVGAQVKQAMERIAALHEGEMSGVLPIHLGTGPVPRISEPSMEIETNELIRQPITVQPGAPAVTVQATVQDLLPGSITTMPGVAPPPIPPAPPRYDAGPPTIPAPPPIPAPPLGTGTLLGVIKPPPVPSRPPTPPVPPRVVAATPARPPVIAPPPPPPPPDFSASPFDGDLDDDREISHSQRLQTVRGGPGGHEDEPPERPTTPWLEQLAAAEDVVPTQPDPPPAAAAPPPPPPPAAAPEPPPEPPPAPPAPVLAPALVPEPPPPGPAVSYAGFSLDAETPIPGEEPRFVEPVPAPELPPPAEPTYDDAAAAVGAAPEIPPPPPPAPAPVEPLPPSLALDSPATTLQSLPPPPPIHGLQPPPPPDYAQGGYPPPAPPAYPQSGYPASAYAAPGARPRRRLPWILGSVASVVALGVGGWFAYAAITAEDDAPAAAGGGSGGGETTAGSAPAPPIALAPVDAPAADAPPAPPPDAPAPRKLSITSTPPGAKVFLDGADVGVTPLELPGSGDRHNLALLLAKHELYLAQVDGHGQFAITLKPVPPAPDFAGIKVLQCKELDRYYVYVDGKPSGQTCPTERINTTLGRHTVEVYDIVTETRRKYDFTITEGRISYRIRLDKTAPPEK